MDPVTNVLRELAGIDAGGIRDPLGEIQQDRIDGGPGFLGLRFELTDGAGDEGEVRLSGILAQIRDELSMATHSDKCPGR